MDRRVNAVVLNYKHSKLACLTMRELAATTDIAVDVLIVDCASGSDEQSALRQCARADRLILLPDNRGYAGGMNIGIEYWLARAPDTPILLVTPDARVPAHAAHALWQALAADSSVAAVGPVVVYGDLPAQNIGAGGAIRAGRIDRHTTVRSSEPYDVDWVEGCCWLLRPEALRSTGALKEEYFLYYEEIDLCHRLTQAGWRVQVVPSVYVHHPKSVGQQPPHYYYYMTRNGLRFWQTNFRMSPFKAGLPILRSVVRLTAIAMVSTVFPARWPEMRARWRDLSLLIQGVAAGTRDHIRGRYGPAPSRKHPG